jgi:hypothetical protein
VAGDEVQLKPPHECERDCWDRQRRRWKKRERVSRGCTRVDIAPVEWHVDPARLTAWHGRPRDTDFDARAWAGRHVPGMAPDRYERPPEPVDDGCPEGWSRSVFVASVLPYIRRRDAQGNRVQNPRLDRCEDRVIVDAVLYFEAEQEALIAYRDEVWSHLMEKQRRGK